MKNDVIESALMLVVVIVLLSMGFRLHANADALKRLMAEEEQKKTLPIPFQQAEGIDINGRDLASESPDVNDLLFMLRGSSFRDDLRFWVTVSGLLPARSTLRMVAYCDGELCVESARKFASIPFPVIARASILSGEALFDADLIGQAVIARRKESIIPATVEWRSHLNPQELIREVSK